MKKNDTPQQAHPIFEGETKGVYALDENGQYTLARSSGWEPEATALQQALDEIERLAQDALQRAKQGETSALEYHMRARRMDTAMLAKAVGKFQWQVRRHFKPAVFNKLSLKDRSTYAQVLDISIESLSELPSDKTI